MTRIIKWICTHTDCKDCTLMPICKCKAKNLDGSLNYLFIKSLPDKIDKYRQINYFDDILNSLRHINRTEETIVIKKSMAEELMAELDSKQADYYWIVYDYNAQELLEVRFFKNHECIFYGRIKS